MSDLDLRELRNAFGTFMTGVTVVTTREKDGTPRGFTANSFCSVSLDPPLLSVCIGKSADSIDVFSETDGYAINILADNQTEISGLFASKRADKFEVAKWHDGPQNHPVLEGVCAWFDCVMEKRVDIGDHVMMIGRVKSFDFGDHNGLGYVRGGYTSLALEQAAVSAAANASKVVVGAIVECAGKLLLLRNPETGRLRPVATGLNHSHGSITRLNARLDELDIGATVSSLYAVFESEDSGRQSIYYRAIADSENGHNNFYSPDNIPWDEIESGAIASMLHRYIDESHDQRYGVYFGNENTGKVQPIAGETK